MYWSDIIDRDTLARQQRFAAYSIELTEDGLDVIWQHLYS